MKINWTTYEDNLGFYRTEGLTARLRGSPLYQVSDDAIVRIAERQADAAAGKELLSAIRHFSSLHNITCPEAIQQNDAVLEQLPDFLATLISIAGYPKSANP